MRRFVLDVIAGRARGPKARVVKALANVASVFYGAGAAVHRLAYRIKVRLPARLPARVVSVGNITAGGTGKTPMCAFLAQRLAERGFRVGVVSRGYGKTTGPASDDENFPINNPKIRRAVGSNRLKTALHLCNEFSPDVVVVDDGFQHYRIARDADIVLVDALSPFSNGRLLPAGLLRERPRGLGRAHVIVLTHADLVNSARLDLVRGRVERLAPGVPILEGVHVPVAALNPFTGRSDSAASLSGRKVLAFCGIGNPESFHRTLESMDVDVVRFVPFPDHMRYAKEVARRINLEAQEFMVELIVTTEKDAMKLDAENFTLPVVFLRIQMSLRKGIEILDDTLDRIVRTKQERVPLAPK